METVRPSEASVDLHRTTRRYFPEDDTLRRLRVFEKKVMKRIRVFRPKTEEDTGISENLITRNFIISTFYQMLLG
jgi:hypothetical protein